MKTRADHEALIDDALDLFERDWSRREEGWIERVLSKVGIDDDPIAIAELVRADIDRHYLAGMSVSLEHYFLRFPELRTTPNLAMEVAFEDYRARASRGLECPVDRWSWLPGVESQSWFVQLRESVPGEPSKGASVDAWQLQGSNSSVAPTKMSPSESRVDRAWPDVGQRLSGFELVALLGKGAFSRVFLARQLSLAGRYVAVKVVDRPLREPSYLARLQHTGIVPLYSYHRIDGLWMLCMPYAGAATLADWLDQSNEPSSRDGQSLITTVHFAQHRLTVAQPSAASGAADSLSDNERHSLRLWNAAGSQPLDGLRRLNASRFGVWLLRRLASALAHAHERGIVHGDLKPANILVRNDGEPALIDFNLSRAAGTELETWIGGTLPYMAPEQLRGLLGQPEAVGPAADVFALGTIMYEVVEGRSPFSAPLSAAHTDVAAAIEQRRATRPFSSSSVATPGLQSIVRKCLSPEIRDRYPTASELLEDVEREFAYRTLRHARESLWRSRLPKLVTRHPRVFSVGPVAMVAASLIVAAALGWWSWRDSSLRLAAAASAQSYTASSEALIAELAAATSSELPETIQRIDHSLKHFIDDKTDTIRETKELGRLSAVDRSRIEKALFDQALLVGIASLDMASSYPESSQRTNYATAANRYLKWCGLFRVHARASSSWFIEQARLAELHSQPELAKTLRLSGLRLNAGDSLDRVLEAQRLLREHHPGRAMDRLREITVLPQPVVLFWLTLGRAQMDVDSLDDAKLSFTQVIGALPDSPMGYFNRGLVQHRQRQYAQAISDFSVAIDRDANLLSGWVNRALARSENGLITDAIADLDVALTIAPESNRLLLMRSRMLRQAGRTREAQDDFEHALRHPPTRVEDWVSRALARLPKDPTSALADLTQARTLEPTSPQVLQNMAHVQSEHLHQVDEAIQSLSLLLTADPSIEQAWAGRSVLYARQRSAVKALADVEQLRSRFPKLMPASRYQIACVHALIADQRPESRSDAIRFLAGAIRVGYGTELLDSDPDLENIREMDDFKILREASRIGAN